MSNNLGRKGKVWETMPWTCSQNLCSPSNGSRQSIRTTTLLRHRTATNTPINKIPTFFVSLFWHSEDTTNNGPTSCISLSHKRNQISVCQHRAWFFLAHFNIEDKQSKIEKHYRLIFACLFTREVHWQTCPGLNTDTFFNAYRQFTCRRCQPILLYSDNGKTFVGASKELKKLVKASDNDKIYKALAAVKTTWRFSPPYGPHFGGMWERLSFDIFETIMVEIDAILISRTLKNVADQPENEEPLTHNHLLIQRPYSSLPPGNFGDQQLASFKNWKHVQQLMNHMWRRLIKGYLPTLLKRRRCQTTISLLWKLEMMCGYSKTWRWEEFGPLEELWKHPLDETVKYELPK